MRTVRGVRKTGGTYQIEIALETAEFLGAKVLGKNRCGKLGDIVDAESFARFRPRDYFILIGTLICFRVQHFEQASRKLLWHTSFSGTRKGHPNQRIG